MQVQIKQERISSYPGSSDQPSARPGRVVRLGTVTVLWPDLSDTGGKKEETHYEWWHSDAVLTEIAGRLSGNTWQQFWDMEKLAEEEGRVLAKHMDTIERETAIPLPPM